MAGYIGTTPVPQATQHRESFTATGGQTSFATVGYTPQFIDVYLNGVKLAPADFTATNGSDVVLASGATASDILEIVAYTPFEVANQTFTGTTTAANLAVTGTFTSRGIDDNADAVAITIDSSENVGIGTSSPAWQLHVKGTSNAVVQIEGASSAGSFVNFGDPSDTDVGQIGYDHTSNYMRFKTNDIERMRIDSGGNLLVGKTVTSSNTAGGRLSNIGSAEFTRSGGQCLYLNRQSSDGTIASFAKDGTTVGSIGYISSGLYIDGEGGHAGLRFGGADISPRDGGADADAAIQLGSSSNRFTDLYLSGGVYLGGTGSANQLDDYEEGTWTPVDNSPAGLTFSSIASARYTKIGRLVKLTASINYPSTADTNRVVIGGFPFSGQSGQAGGGFVHYTDNGIVPNINVGGTSSSLSCYTASGGLFQNAQMSGHRIDFTVIYEAT